MKEKPVKAQKTEKVQGHDTAYPGIESCRLNLMYSLFGLFSSSTSMYSLFQVTWLDCNPQILARTKYKNEL
jgi:hypothetical protein